jgi:hypothetical protein
VPTAATTTTTTYNNNNMMYTVMELKVFSSKDICQGFYMFL